MMRKKRLFTKDLDIGDSVGVCNVGESGSQVKRRFPGRRQSRFKDTGTKQHNVFRDLSIDRSFYSPKAHSDFGDSGKN